MSTIRCIYSAEPNFPATDQHPDAVRYQVAGVWVDAIDGEPTEAEVGNGSCGTGFFKIEVGDDPVAAPAFGPTLH